MTRLPAVHLFYRRGTSTQGRRGHPMAMLLCSLDETRPLEIITKNNNDASTQLAPTRLIAFAMYFFQSFQSKTRKQPSKKTCEPRHITARQSPQGWARLHEVRICGSPGVHCHESLRIVPCNTGLGRIFSIGSCVQWLTVGSVRANALTPSPKRCSVKCAGGSAI